MNDQTRYNITRECLIECLAPLLTQPTLGALLAGVIGENGAPATVGHVIELYEAGRLTDIYNVGSGRAGEIRQCLVAAKLIKPNSAPLIRHRYVREANNGHYVKCHEHGAT